MKILLGTNNKHKIKEIKDILNENEINIEVLSLADFSLSIQEPVEDGNSYYENALIKAKYYYEQFKIPVIADDTGLEVFTLNNQPGIFSSRFASQSGEHSSSYDNRKKLLDEMKDKINRNASFKCVMVYYDGKNIYEGKGQMDGEITTKEIGDNGFGYDSIFYLPEYKTSVAELDEKAKNMISHRHNALINLIEILTKKGLIFA